MKLGKIIQKNLKGVGKTMQMFGVPGGAVVEQIGKMVNKPGKGKTQAPAVQVAPQPAQAPSQAPAPAPAPASFYSAPSQVEGKKDNTMLLIGMGIVVIFVVVFMMRR